MVYSKTFVLRICVRKEGSGRQETPRTFAHLHRCCTSCLSALKLPKLILKYADGDQGPLEIRRLADDGLEALPSELKARWVGEPEGNERTSREDGDSSNSDDGSGAHVVLGVATDFCDRGTDSGDESVNDYAACSLENCGYCGHCPTSPVYSKHESRMRILNQHVKLPVVVCGRVVTTKHYS